MTSSNEKQRQKDWVLFHAIHDRLGQSNGQVDIIKAMMTVLVNGHGVPYRQALDGIMSDLRSLTDDETVLRDLKRRRQEGRS